MVAATFALHVDVVAIAAGQRLDDARVLIEPLANEAGDYPVVDPTTGVLYVRTIYPLGKTGAAVLTLPKPTAMAPANYQYRATVQYRPFGSHYFTELRRVIFSVPADAATLYLGKLVDTDFVPPQYVPALLTARDQAVAAAVAADDSADAAATSAGAANASAVQAQATADAVPATTNAAMTTVDANAASSFRVQQDARLLAFYAPKRGREVQVENARLAGDTDAQAIQRAVTLARTTGAKRIILPKSYVLTTQVNLSGLTGVVIEGEGAGLTDLSATAAIGAAFTTNGACSDLLIKGIGFTGNVVDDVPLNAPRRSRTTSGSSFVNAILLRGNLDPRAGSPAYEVRNIRVEDVDFTNISSLPILVQGIAGDMEFIGAHVYNCLDSGFIFCDSVKVYDFTSRKSADNGISLSRGNRRVILDGYEIEGCAYHGIWASGYEADGSLTDVGPTEVVIGAGVVKTAGLDGIQVFNAPDKVVISGALINGCLRGPSDEPADQAGVGIKIGGFPYNTPGALTRQATNVLVANVEIINAARGGIHLRGVTDCKIDGALIVNPGSEFMANGTTPVSSSSLDENFGVSVDSSYASTVIRPSVRNVRTIDTRATPLANHGVCLTGSVNPDYADNTTVGVLRNPQQYDGSTGPNGPATGNVRQRWMRNGVAYMDLQLNSSNELEMVARDTSGNVLQTLVTFGRVTGKTTFGAGSVVQRRSSVAAAATVAFDANAANLYSVVMSATLVTASSITNPTTGQQLTIVLVQDPTGGRTFAWPANCKFAGGAAPTDTTANKRTAVTFNYDGTNWNEISRAVAVG